MSETVDTRAFFETLRLRWWIFPTIVFLALVFLQIQESNLRTSPSTVVVSRTFEIDEPARPLASVGIKIDVAEFPETQTQLLILQSNETREEIAAIVGKDIEVQVPDTWDSLLTFTCNQPVSADCELAIDAYLKKYISIRESAIVTGLSNTRAVLDKSNRELQNPDISKQVATIDALLDNFRLGYVLVDGFEQSVGATVFQIENSTYLLAVVSALLLSILIILQLTYTDSRVRSERQLLKLVEDETYLGTIQLKPNPVRDRRVAISLLHEARVGTTVRARYIPLRHPITSETLTARMTELAGGSHVAAPPFSEQSVAALSGGDTSECDVLVVQRNRDRRQDVRDAVLTMKRADRKFAGVLLLN